MLLQKRIWLLAALLLLLAMPAALAGAPRHMDFDGIRVTLGQAADKALSRLHGTFDLRPVAGQSGSYTVGTKSQKSKILGIVTFQNGYVARLERERGSFADNGQATTLIALVKELLKEDNNRAEISVAKQLQDGVSYETITLKFPGKRLLITVSNPLSDNSQVWIREILE